MLDLVDYRLVFSSAARDLRQAIGQAKIFRQENDEHPNVLNSASVLMIATTTLARLASSARSTVYTEWAGPRGRDIGKPEDARIIEVDSKAAIDAPSDR